MPSGIYQRKLRQIIIKEDYALVPLTQGKFAIIDLEDIEKIKDYNWYCQKNRNTFYANKFSLLKKSKLISLHNIINPPPKNMFNDHIDFDGLNNKKSNLRFCTHQQNMMNKRKCKNLSSKFKGVTWDESSKKWMSRIRYKNKCYPLGRFKNEIDAARAYDKKALELFAEFALTNKMLGLL